MEKIFKTINEQIDILKDKNLIIEDEEQAKEILLRENYFFLMGYRHVFMKKKNSFLVQHFLKYTHYSHLIGILEI